MEKTSISPIELRPVDSENWLSVAQLSVTTEQRKFVAEPSYYLALCHYGQLWRPLAIYDDERVIGFMMWAEDSDEGSCWIGGFMIDKSLQKMGYGNAALTEVVRMLSSEHGYRDFALSYGPGNIVAKQMYSQFGFSETGEMAEDELVARFKLSDAPILDKD